MSEQMAFSSDVCALPQSKMLGEGLAGFTGIGSQNARLRKLGTLLPPT